MRVRVPDSSRKVWGKTRGGGGTGEMGINGDVHWVEYDFPVILLSRVISGVSLRDCFESTTAKCLTVNPCHA